MNLHSLERNVLSRLYKVRSMQGATKLLQTYQTVALNLLKTGYPNLDNLDDKFYQILRKCAFLRFLKLELPRKIFREWKFVPSPEIVRSILIRDRLDLFKLIIPSRVFLYISHEDLFRYNPEKIISHVLKRKEMYFPSSSRLNSLVCPTPETREKFKNHGIQICSIIPNRGDSLSKQVFLHPWEEQGVRAHGCRDVRTCVDVEFMVNLFMTHNFEYSFFLQDFVSARIGEEVSSDLILIMLNMNDDKLFDHVLGKVKTLSQLDSLFGSIFLHYRDYLDHIRHYRLARLAETSNHGIRLLRYYFLYEWDEIEGLIEEIV